jgi:sn-glycerol 3-phosphate transport system permease protein
MPATAEPGIVEDVGPDTDVLDVAAPGGVATATTIGRSRGRMIAGLAGQYGLLVALAAVVLTPLFFTLINALSPPNDYREAGRPLHPVAVEWQDRTWWTGGAVSIVARTALVGVILLWAQHRAAGRRLGPRQLTAAVTGTVAVAVLTTPIFRSLFERSGQTVLWFAVAMAALAATQLVGFLDAGRPGWQAALNSGLLGVALVGAVVVAVGAGVWTEGWDRGDLGSAMGRSLVVTTLITVCQVATSVLAAYAFAYLRFPFKTLAFAVFMGTLLLPLEVTLLANVQTIRELEWIDSTQALVLPFAATAFGTFLIRQGFRGIPPEIRDATRLDGYGHVDFLWRFAVPLTRPVIAAFTVIAAMGAWNQFLWPQAVIDSDSGQTTQIRLDSLRAEVAEASNVHVAAAVIVALPMVLLLIAFSRQIIRGLTAGAVKG